MAKFLRSIFVGKIDKTARVNEFQLAFFVDAVLSNPLNKRYHSLFEGKTLLQVFTHMVSTVDAGEFITISNGTKTVKLTAQDWKSVISTNLKVYDVNDKSKNLD